MFRVESHGEIIRIRMVRPFLGRTFRECFLAFASFGDFSKRNLVRSLLAGP